MQPHSRGHIHNVELSGPSTSQRSPLHHKFQHKPFCHQHTECTDSAQLLNSISNPGCRKGLENLLASCSGRAPGAAELCRSAIAVIQSMGALAACLVPDGYLCALISLSGGYVN
ncbi:hypothetical protein ROHU_015138 [Labeo rohita]|uniref:Uncharacterized protein n=1 Tax=Labeo rohita TaxID=84645 RepID=A0A498NQD8_LABRO|nr:hypothetical protein ROHU_015138 [Labeo rohita]